MGRNRGRGAWGGIGGVGRGETKEIIDAVNEDLTSVLDVRAISFWRTRCNSILSQRVETDEVVMSLQVQLQQSKALMAGE